MQLKTVGESLNASKTIQKIVGSTTNSAKSYNLLQSALSGYSTETVKAAINQSVLTEAQIKTVLASKGLKGEALNAAAAELSQAQAANTLSKSTKGLNNVFTGLGRTLKSFITTHPVITALIGVAAAFGIVSSSVQDAQEKMNRAFDTQENYNSTKSDIESINGELESTSSKIDEIKAKENISLIDQKELKNLENQTIQLQQQLEYKEKLASIQEKQTAQDSANAINSYSLKNAVENDGGAGGKILRFFAGLGDKVGIGNLVNDLAD